MAAMERTLLQIFDIFYRILHFFLHYFLALLYMFSKRRVPAVKNPVLLMSATELAKHIRDGKLTSESIVQAFIDRILEVEPFINATVERRFEDALKEAKEADTLVASNTMTKEELEKRMPLLGVPFSVKVLLTVKGLRCTGGSILFKNVRAEEDAESVSLMKKAGAIVLVTTNSPEAGLNFQSSNNLHGTTCNPYDTTKTSGGSSGGESALLGAAGSVIGLGNDLGGSIRLPCMFTGLFGHKPSRGLVSNAGCFPTPTGKLDRYLSTGPMCRYAEDVETMMKILSADNVESTKFGKKVNFKDIKVYYMLSFGDIPFVEKVDESIMEAVNKIVSHFELNKGSRAETVTIPLVEHFFLIFTHALISSTPDLADCITAGREKVDAFQEFLKFLCLQSRFTLGFIVILLFSKKSLIYNPSLVEFYKKLEEQVAEYFDNILDENSVLILPTVPFVAPYNNEITLLTASTIYTSIFNILGMPSTQCPVGFNDSGLPVGVQIVSKRGNDCLTVACAREVEKAFGGWKSPQNNNLNN